MIQTRWIRALAAGVILAARFAAAAEPAKPVTFSKDVAPILQAECQSCHEPGSIAPMALITYQDARPWARSSTSPG
jgi:cytochrome c553